MPEQERNYYVICDDNCKFPAMTKEETIAAIAEATGETPVHIDDAFISKIKEQNRNASLKWWAGTEAEYNSITTKSNDTLYVITDIEDNAVVKGDFAVVTGSITMNDGSGTTNINYPTGFNKDNCVVISAGIAITSVYDYYVGTSSISIGVRLAADNIKVTTTKIISSGPSSTKDVKVVLMKI